MDIYGLLTKNRPILAAHPCMSQHVPPPERRKLELGALLNGHSTHICTHPIVYYFVSLVKQMNVPAGHVKMVVPVLRKEMGILVHVLQGG